MPLARRRTIALPALSLLLAFLVGVVAAAPATADAPFQLPAQVVDAADALTTAQENELTRAVDKLSNDENLQLSVVYVRDFSGKSPADWGRETQQLNEMSYRDILLAIDVGGHAFYFGSAEPIEGFPASRLSEIADSAIAPAVRAGKWQDAALDATADLDGERSRAWTYLLVAAIVVLALVAALSVLLFRRSKRRQAEDDDAPDSGEILTVDELTAQPLDVLDPWSVESLLSTDDAVSVSGDELALAVDEFGEQAVAPFRAALTTAESAVATSFQLRHTLDERGDLDPGERRALLVQIISMCSDADGALDDQVAYFDGLRNLLADAPGRLDVLAERSARLAARLDDAAEHEAAVAAGYDGPVAASVAGNVDLARELVQFADDSIEQGRESLADPAETDQATVAAIRSAECALETAGKLLDALADAELNLALIGDRTGGLAAAIAQVSAAESFIDTRRGAIGARARTCLSEAERLLGEAGDDDESGPIARASALAQQALALSSDDVAAWLSSSSHDGAPVLTGVLVDAVIATGPQAPPVDVGNGGFTSGGRTPGSFGGSDTSGRIATGGRR